MTSSTLRLAIPAVLLLSAAGCFSIGGGSDTTSTTSTLVQPTTGQQLIDLKRALDTGVITTNHRKAVVRLLAACEAIGRQVMASPNSPESAAVILGDREGYPAAFES
jgi:hypothetical protein